MSIVAVSWNTIDCLPAALDAIPSACGTLTSEIIVVDNGSSDGSASVLASRTDSRVVQLPDNTGFTHAANLGASLARGRLLLFLNPDVVAPAASIQQLAAVLDQHPEAWAATPWFRYPDGTPQYFWRRLPTAASTVLCFLHRGRRLDRFAGGRAMRRHRYLDLPDPPQTGPIEAVGAACLLARRADFEDSGAFDTRYFNFFQDTDFHRGMHRRGRVLLGVGSVEVTHQLGVTFRRLPPADAHGQMLHGLLLYLGDEPWLRRTVGRLAIRLETIGRGAEWAEGRRWLDGSSRGWGGARTGEGVSEEGQGPR